MTHRLRLVAALTAGLAALASAPAHADESTGMPLHGYSQTEICVVRTDPAAGWRVGAAIRAWNAAQTSVHLSTAAVPGCDVLEIREFAGPEHPDWNGYVELGGMEDSATHQRNIYHVAQVWLNHAKLVDSFKPKYKGTNRKCWRQRVVAHEIGHALGLDHTTGSESVMSYEHDYLRYCGTPSAGDAAAVVALYTPV